jgi:hypothetical protein
MGVSTQRGLHISRSILPIPDIRWHPDFVEPVILDHGSQDNSTRLGLPNNCTPICMFHWSYVLTRLTAPPERGKRCQLPTSLLLLMTRNIFSYFTPAYATTTIVYNLSCIHQGTELSGLSSATPTVAPVRPASSVFPIHPSLTNYTPLIRDVISNNLFIFSFQGIAPTAAPLVCCCFSDKFHTAHTAVFHYFFLVASSPFAASTAECLTSVFLCPRSPVALTADLFDNAFVFSALCTALTAASPASLANLSTLLCAIVAPTAVLPPYSSHFNCLCAADTAAKPFHYPLPTLPTNPKLLVLKSRDELKETQAQYINLRLQNSKLEDVSELYAPPETPPLTPIPTPIHTDSADQASLGQHVLTKRTSTRLYTLAFSRTCVSRASNLINQILRIVRNNIVCPSNSQADRVWSRVIRHAHDFGTRLSLK